MDSDRTLCGDHFVIQPCSTEQWFSWGLVGFRMVWQGQPVSSNRSCHFEFWSSPWASDVQLMEEGCSEASSAALGSSPWRVRAAWASATASIWVTLPCCKCWSLKIHPWPMALPAHTASQSCPREPSQSQRHVWGFLALCPALAECPLLQASLFPLSVSRTWCQHQSWGRNQHHRLCPTSRNPALVPSPESVVTVVRETASDIALWARKPCSVEM